MLDLLQRLDRRLDGIARRLGDLGSQLLEHLLRGVDEGIGLVPGLDELPAPAVVLRIDLGVLHRLVDLRMVHPLGCHDRELLRLACRLVRRGHVQDAIRVDVERDLDLGDVPRRGRDPRQEELPQAHVLVRHRPLALEDVDLDRRLAVRRGCEGLALPRGDRRVPLDELVHNPPLGLHAQAQGRHVEEEDVLHLAAQDGPLDRRAEGHALHGVDTALRGPPEDPLEPLADYGHPGRASDEDDVVHVLRLPFRVLERLANRGLETREHGLNQGLQLRAGQLPLQVEGLAALLRDEREVNRRLHGARELDLRLLSRVAEALHRLAVPGQVDAVLAPALGGEPLDERVVHVEPPELGIAGSGGDLEDAVAHLHQSHVEGSASEIQDADPALTLLVEAVGKRRGRRLVHEPEDLEPRDLARVLRRLALVVIEVRGDGDHGLGDLLPEEGLRVRQ